MKKNVMIVFLGILTSFTYAGGRPEPEYVNYIIHGNPERVVVQTKSVRESFWNRSESINFMEILYDSADKVYQIRAFAQNNHAIEFFDQYENLQCTKRFENGELISSFSYNTELHPSFNADGQITRLFKVYENSEIDVHQLFYDGVKRNLPKNFHIQVEETGLESIRVFDKSKLVQLQRRQIILGDMAYPLTPLEADQQYYIEIFEFDENGNKILHILKNYDGEVEYKYVTEYLKYDKYGNWTERMTSGKNLEVTEYRNIFYRN